MKLLHILRKKLLPRLFLENDLVIGDTVPIVMGEYVVRKSKRVIGRVNHPSIDNRQWMLLNRPDGSFSMTKVSKKSMRHITTEEAAYYLLINED